MLDLLCFDLDGTLVQSERLKAQSYARAAHELRGDVDPADVEAAFGDVVGLSREDVAQTLLDRFELAEAARQRDVSVEPWEAYVNVRLEIYEAMTQDPAIIQGEACPYAGAVARRARNLAQHVALVTTSDREATDAVLRALDLARCFDLILTADDVERTKPNPEGYQRALDHFSVEAHRALTLEDSPSGIRAAIAAGIPLVLVPNEMTASRVKTMVGDGEVDDGDVVWDLNELASHVDRRVASSS
ncbi:MAG: HAD family hydrolase [Rubricoccaceae bacterium]